MFIHQYPTRNGDKLQQIGRFILAWSCASPPPVLKAVSSSQSITFSTLTQPTQSHDLNQQPSVRSDSQSLLQQQQLINTSDNQYLSFRRPLVDDSVVGGGIKRERKKKAKIPKYPLQQRSRPEKSVVCGFIIHLFWWSSFAFYSSSTLLYLFLSRHSSLLTLFLVSFYATCILIGSNRR